MKVSIIVKQVTLCISLLLIVGVIAASTACTEEKPVNADEITGNVLQAVMEGDYAKYMSYGDIRWGIGGAGDFGTEVAAIKDELGEYETDSLKYWKTEKENSLISVFYKAKFTKAPEVTVKSAFSEVVGTTWLVGFWLNP